VRVEHRIEHGMFVRRIQSAGEPCGLLLWIHGLGESGLCFDKVVAEPALVDFDHLVPDLPGYGRSCWPATAPSLVDLAGHLARWMDDADLGPAVVVGHSMGGVVGLLLAEEHPQRVAGLVSVDANISPQDCVYSGRAAAWPLEDFVGGGFDQLREEILTRGINDPASRGYYASLRLAHPATFHRNSLELVAASVGEPMAARLARLTLPVCYVAGVPNGASRESIAHLEEAGVVLSAVAPSGHWPFIDQPSRFAAELVRWIGNQMGSEGGGER
jgi:pimeloyl-ACP methyl ester carboxylesterase